MYNAMRPRKQPMKTRAVQGNIWVKLSTGKSSVQSQKGNLFTYYKCNLSIYLIVVGVV